MSACFTQAKLSAINLRKNVLQFFYNIFCGGKKLKKTNLPKIRTHFEKKSFLKFIRKSYKIYTNPIQESDENPIQINFLYRIYNGLI
jgi:hypothetical protein